MGAESRSGWSGAGTEGLPAALLGVRGQLALESFWREGGTCWVGEVRSRQGNSLCKARLEDTRKLLEYSGQQ